MRGARWGRSAGRVHEGHAHAARLRPGFREAGCEFVVVVLLAVGDDKFKRSAATGVALLHSPAQLPIT